MEVQPGKPESLSATLVGKWHVPLLLLALFGFAVGLWHIYGARKQPSIDDDLNRVERLLQLGQYSAAHDQGERLLPLREQMTDLEEARLALLLAEAIYLSQESLGYFNPANDLKLIQYYHRALDLGVEPTSALYVRLGNTRRRSGDYTSAIKQYFAALPLTADSDVRIRRRIVETMIQEDREDPSPILMQLDHILATGSLSQSELGWAVCRRSELLIDSVRAAEAEKFLIQVSSQLQAGKFKSKANYLLGLSQYDQGRLDEAERTLRAFRDQIELRTRWDAQSTLLLGRINSQQQRPQDALAFYEEVIRSFVGSDEYIAAKLGRAEALAELQRNQEALEQYHELVPMIISHSDNHLIDKDAVRASLISRYQLARGKEAYKIALRYLAIEEQLVKSADASLSARMAETYALRAEELERVQMLVQTGNDASRSLGEVSYLFRRSGEYFRQLADASVIDDDDAYGDALWNAAENFDRAGQWEQAVESLRIFVYQRPNDPRSPMALFRLGQAYESQTQFPLAIEMYEVNRSKHPAHVATYDSLIPLARCYLRGGEEEASKAEHILIHIVTNNSFFRPEAKQFREALFELGSLYFRQKQWAKCIRRLEEAVQRYPDDSQTIKAMYLLADAYRRGGQMLDERIAEAENAALQQELAEERSQRLRRAKDLFEAIINWLQPVAEEDITADDAVCLMQSYLFRADCVFELGEYTEALELYKTAAFRYPNDLMALSANLQIVFCYYRLGNLESARTANERAKWLLTRMPKDAFKNQLLNLDEQHWQQWQEWIGEVFGKGAPDDDWLGS